MNENDFLILSFDTQMNISNGVEEEISYLNIGISSAMNQILSIKMDYNLSKYQYLDFNEWQWDILSGLKFSINFKGSRLKSQSFLVLLLYFFFISISRKSSSSRC